MEAGSESDGEPGEENDSVEQVMRLEFDNAAEELGINQEVISKDGVFLEFDVNAVSVFVSAKAQVGYKKNALEGMNEESSVEDKAEIEAELVTLKETVVKQAKVVEKAKRAKLLRDRKAVLQSPKRSKTQTLSRAASSSPDTKKHCAGPSSGDDYEWLHRATSPDFEEAPDASDIVPVVNVIEGMLDDADICVKLFYAPTDISKRKSNYSQGGSFDLYENRVGAGGLEYNILAKGNAATKALELLADFAGRVVTLRHVKFASYKGESHLELRDEFEVLDDVGEADKQQLQRQQLKRCTVKQLPEQKDLSRVSLVPCAVGGVSEVKFDKNGNPYRGTRVSDESGAVTNVMVWGCLAQSENLWKNDTVVDIMAADVSHIHKRINLREFSQVVVSGKTGSFKKASRLTFVVWPS
jgi:hypothetical protein